MGAHFKTLHQIVRHGLNTNSYKFALWRALVSLAPATNPRNPVISKQNLSPLFLRYYWPLEVKYHVRQGIDPDKDPVVMVAIRNLLREGVTQHGEDLSEFRKRNPHAYEKLRHFVSRKAFEYVIPCFHNVRGGSANPEIFRFTGTPGKAGNDITLTGDARPFLIDQARLIDFVATAGWVRFTESFTTAPKLFDKISGDAVKRSSLTRWRAQLLSLQRGACFYGKHHSMSDPEVDHFLPWSFVLENRTWNLVLACKRCNGEKRDRLPTREHLNKVIAGNREIAKDASVVDVEFARHFEEWQTRDLSGHMRSLYDQAVADQFPFWTGSSAQ